MNKTWKERVTCKLQRSMEKHKYGKVFIQIELFVITGLYDIGAYFVYNTKRLSCIAAVFAFFIISSSFSFPGMQEQQTLEDSRALEIQENYDYSPTVLDLEDIELLDDEDVIEGYDNEELDVQDQIDQFSLDDILEANEISRNTSAAEDSASEMSADDWRLVLVNKQHPVPDDYSFTLGTITGNMKCDVRIIDDLMAMMQAAAKDGINLMVCSPYRDYNRQTVLFNRKIDSYMAKGYSYLEAYRIASITVTVPGASEHQIGLAIDFVCDTYSLLEIEFEETDAGQWLKNHACEYGFILRYPRGKEYITGIQYEPWHYRYVGKEAATIIMSQGITLEEFLEEL